MKNLLLFLFYVVSIPVVSAQSWGTQNNPVGDDAKGICFIPGTAVGYTVSINGRIVKTTDGGLHWNIQTSGTRRNLYGIFFTNVDSGFVVGDSGLVLYTFDGGTSWNALQAPTNKALNRIDLYSNGKGMIVGDSGTVFKFSYPDFIPVNTGTYHDLSALDVVNEDTSYLIVNEEAGAVLMATFNGWSSQQVMPVADSAKLNQVFFSSPTTGWAAGHSGALLRTTDGGFNWTSVNSSTTQNLYALLVLNDSMMYAGGAGGTVIAYRNDSLWTNQVSGISNAVQSLSYSDQYTIYGAASGGQIIKTCPYVSFRNNANDTSCASNAITFFNHSANALTYAWYLDTTFIGDSMHCNRVFDTAGVYQLKLLADNGTCSSFLTQAFYVFEQPVKLLGNDTMICSSCSYNLNAGDVLNTYAWYRNGIQLINAGHSINVTEEGNYSVYVTNPAGCSQWDSITVTMATGMNEHALANLTVYPNPVSRILYVRSNTNTPTGIRMLTVTGTEVLAKVPSTNSAAFEEELDVSDLAKGLYFVEVTAGNERVVRKVMVR